MGKWREGQIKVAKSCAWSLQSAFVILNF